jgi:hypothetical protein
MSINFNLNTSQEVSTKKFKGNSINISKKNNIKRWQNNENKKNKKTTSSDSLQGFILTSVPLDFSHYRNKENNTMSHSSTSNTEEKDIMIKQLSDSLIDEKNDIINITTNLKINDDNMASNLNSHFIIDNNLTLKEGDFIYDNSIKIIKFLSEGGQARIYLGLIEEIDKFVAIKRYNMPNYDQHFVEKIMLECEMLKSLEHDNIIKYFDIEVNYDEEVSYNNIV